MERINKFIKDHIIDEVHPDGPKFLDYDNIYINRNSIWFFM